MFTSKIHDNYLLSFLIINESQILAKQQLISSQYTEVLNSSSKMTVIPECTGAEVVVERHVHADRAATVPFTALIATFHPLD